MTGDEQLMYRVAVGLYPAINFDVLSRMQRCGMSYEDFFTSEAGEVSFAAGIVVDDALRAAALEKAKTESEFMLRHHIRCHLCIEADYPFRMRAKQGVPAILFVMGDATLNPPVSVSFVGTRRATAYGLNFARPAIEEIAARSCDTNIVSGLAYGIDASAHLAALDASLPTVAVVAHGLDTIFPAKHRDLARSILDSGGALVTEYPTGNPPFRGRFLERNRIIAGLSDLTVVVESDRAGGSLSTAAHARNLNHQVAAVPGRLTDQYSSGCNDLIASGRAVMITSPGSVADMLGLQKKNSKGVAVTPSLVPEMSDEQKPIYLCLQNSLTPMTPDQILSRVGIPVAKLLAILNEMVCDAIVLRHPGNRYSVAF